MGVEIALAVASIAATVYSSKQASKASKIKPTPLPAAIKDDPAPTVSTGIATEQDRRRRNLSNLRTGAVGTGLGGLSDAGEEDLFATPTLLGG